MNNYTNELQDMGLSKNQSEVYALLIKHGEQTGSELTKQAGISRQLTYKVIDELVEMNLCEKKNKSGSVSTFVPTHPSQLTELIEGRQRNVDTARKQLGVVIDNLISDYNLEQGRPSVRFVEGERGVEQALMDTLAHPEETIYTYAEPQAIKDNILAIDEKYRDARYKKKVHKKIILLDSPLAQQLYNKGDDAYTERRIATEKTLNMRVPAALEIYHGKISYITFKNDLKTVSTIDDETIYQLHRQLFEDHWNRLG